MTLGQDRTESFSDYVHWRLIAAGVVITAVALGLYFENVADKELWLFIAGLSGGATVAELASAGGRREAAKQGRELTAEVRAGRAPALRAAANVGMSVAVKNGMGSPDDVDYLQIHGALQSMAGPNDLSGVCDALRARWGNEAATAFMLGRQLTLLLVPDDEAAVRDSRGLVEERLLEVLKDPEVARAASTFVARPETDSERQRARMIYVGALLEYIKGDGSSREQILDGPGAVKTASTTTSRRDEVFKELIDQLIDEGVGDTDPDVLLFHGVISDDRAAIQAALDAGGQADVVDHVVIRRHGKRLLASSPDLYHEYFGGP